MCLFIVASFQQTFRRQRGNFPVSYLDLRKEKENYSLQAATWLGLELPGRHSMGCVCEGDPREV